MAAILYFAAMVGWLTQKDRPSRLLWTAACAFYLAHLVAAFSFYHHWSHAAAYTETARQTFEVFGLRWGGGLYFNYVFTAVWIADVLRWWCGIDRYRSRRALTTAIHSFFAFMFFNATVVFVGGWTRWLAVAAMAALAVLVARASACQGAD